MTDAQITATYVRQIEGWRGDARLFRLSAAVPDDYGEATVDHVIVSAVHVLGEPETYIFPANADGECLNYLEMAGSQRWTTDHEEVIRAAGWELVPA